MNEPKIEITVMPGAQMNGYVNEQHNYFGTVVQTTKDYSKNARFAEATEAEVMADGEEEGHSVQGEAKQDSRKKDKKGLVAAEGLHPAFPVIEKGSDPYRKAQVSDLFDEMKQAKKICGLKQAEPDLKEFLMCFTKGNTSAVIPWLGSKRELHFIVYEWKHRGYITSENEDSLWMIASKVFVNPKEKVNGRPTFFDAKDLRTTRNPKLIPQELEDIVEKLNPETPSPNYERFRQSAEDNINFGHKVAEQKRLRQNPNAAQADVFEHAFDEDYDDEKQLQEFLRRRH